MAETQCLGVGLEFQNRGGSYFSCRHFLPVVKLVTVHLHTTLSDVEHKYTWRCVMYEGVV